MTEEEKAAKPQPKPRKPTYAEGVFAKWVDRFAQMKLEVQKLPGELMRGAVQLGLDALLGKTAVSDEPEAESGMDLLDFCVNVLGGTIGWVTETGSVGAPPVSGSMGDTDLEQFYHGGTEARQQLGMDCERGDPLWLDESNGTRGSLDAGPYRSQAIGRIIDIPDIQGSIS